MSRMWNRNWVVSTVLAATLFTVFDRSHPHSRILAADPLAIDVNAAKETVSSPADEEKAVGANAEKVTVNSEELESQTLKETIANAMRLNTVVCGVVFGEVTAKTLAITVLLEESAKKQPSDEDLLTDIRHLSGEREVKLYTKPWAAAARLSQFQTAIKGQPDLVDVSLVNLCLLGLAPNKLVCHLQGTAKDPNSQDALVVAVTGLVTAEFESPVGKPNTINASLEVNFDSAPLMKAIDESLADNADLIGLRIERITAIRDVESSIWKLELRGESPLPLNDDVKLVELVNGLLPSAYPKWKDKLELQTPLLADRIPDAAIVLSDVQKALRSSSDWQNCELTKIVVGLPTAEGRLVWTLMGKLAQPLQETQLIELCHEVVVQVSPWWKRAKERLQIVSKCAVVFPAHEPFVTHIQRLLKLDPVLRGCQLKRIDATTTGGNSDRGGPVVMTWSLVGEVYHPGQKERLMALIQEEHCRLQPEWKEYSGLRFEEQLKQVPADPAPVLTVLQNKLSRNFGWDGCKLTSLGCAACNKPDPDQTQIWQINGTVAFMSQKVDLLELANEALREAYPGWEHSEPPQFDPNSVKIVHPSATTLLALIQHDLERMPQFDDCQILDVLIDPNVEPSAQQLHLNLIGRTSRLAHQQALVSLNQFPSLKERYGKKVTVGDEAQIIPNPSDVDVVESSRGLATSQFEIGQNHYVHREFAQARTAFAAAMFEDASNLNYKLWHVAMCLATGDEQLAHDRLFRILRGHRGKFRNSEDFRVAMRSLERLQGCLRRQLEDLERQVHSEIIPIEAQARR